MAKKVSGTSRKTKKAPARSRTAKKKGTAATGTSLALATLRAPFDVPAELRRLGGDLRTRAQSVLKDIESRQRSMEKEGARLIRNLVRQFRIGLQKRMGDLQRRIARLEKQAAALERRLR